MLSSSAPAQHQHTADCQRIVNSIFMFYVFRFVFDSFMFSLLFLFPFCVASAALHLVSSSGCLFFGMCPRFAHPLKQRHPLPPTHDLFVFLIFECNISVFLCAPFFRAAYAAFLVNVCWQFVGCFGEPLNSYKFMSVNSRRKSIFNAFPFPFGSPPNVNSKLMRRQLCIRENVYLEQFEFPLLLEWKTSRIRMEM